MNLFMTGIDFNKADIKHRERFALTQTAQVAALKEIRTYPGVSGCVIVSTCNRMELWISCDAPPEKGPFEMLCRALQIDAGDQADYFVNRQGDEAVRHLFELACGLKSMIFGEEQILSQVKESIAFAHECGAADAVLHALFRYAVTSAKKVKTSVRLDAVDRSVAGTTIRLLKERFGCLEGLGCLVIGSGEIGRLAVKGLVAEGCSVTMTLRQFKSGNAVIPSGCSVIRYEDRYELYPKVRAVISATRSPHFTLSFDTVKQLGCSGEKTLFDLAVPRDIDPEIANLENIDLYDIDHLGGSLVDRKDNTGLLQAQAIVKDEIKAFERWYSVRRLMPLVSEIGAVASEDVQARIKYHLKNCRLDEDARQLVHEAAGDAVSKVVEKILLSLHKNTDSRLFLSCVDELDAEKTGRKDEEYPLRFPLYIDLSGREVVVVGAGAVAFRRISALLSFNCHITVVAPEAHEGVRQLYDEKVLCLKSKSYEASDIENAFLVIAATDDRALNHKVAEDAGGKGLYCSVADCKEECTFYFPAVVPYPGGVIGICGTGEDHRQTKKISTDIRAFIRSKEEA